MSLRFCHIYAPPVLWILLGFDPQVSATSCQVYPSEYAYHKDSFNRGEGINTVCMMYQVGTAHYRTEDYIHCNGSQLKLIDSDLGKSKVGFNSGDYYVWPISTTNSQILFIFPTRVNLTTLTLHYYSDSVRGLPRLRFFSVSNTFDVWLAPTVTYRYVDVPAEPNDGQPDGHRNVSISFNFNTDRVLMNMPERNTYPLAVSEVEFFTCTDQITTTRVMYTSTTNTEAKTSMMVLPNISHSAISLRSTFHMTESTSSTESYIITTQGSKIIPQESGNNITVSLTTGLAAIVLILLAAPLLLIVVLLLWHNKRTHSVKRFEKDLSHSTLEKVTKQQTQPHSVKTQVELYNQLQLSPFTGQSEFIHKNESENIIISLSSGSYEMKVPTVTETNSDLLETEKNNSDCLTYAVVDKKTKYNEGNAKQELDDTSQKGIHPEHLTTANPEDCDTAEKPKDQPSQGQENLEEMYAIVHKKPKKYEEDAPPIPPHTIECLYAAVQKKSK